MAQVVDLDRSTSTHVRPLLIAGAIAGPLYVTIGTLEAVLRSGFDIRIHSLSLLTNGPWGWIHSVMMVVTGLLTVVGALGLSDVQRRTSSRSYAMIIGLMVYGLGLATAGLLHADPAEGFPIGTPPGPPVVVTASGRHRSPGSRGNRLPWSDRGVFGLCKEIGTQRRSCLGGLLCGDRNLLSRRLRGHRFGSRQFDDQHRLYRCGRTQLGVADCIVCSCTRRKGVAPRAARTNRLIRMSAPYLRLRF